jgi:ELWxxDGT repeat protein
MPGSLTAVGDRLFFIDHLEGWAPGPGPGNLWTSDGTSAGTYLVRDLLPGDRDWVSGLTAFQGRAYLAGQHPDGVALWKSDGTEQGTRAVTSFEVATPHHMIRVGSELFFWAGDPNDAVLMRTDGTTAGTFTVSDVSVYFCPSLYQSCPDYREAALGGILYFPSEAGPKGIELWRSDGTESGTRRLRDIHPGAIGSRPSELVRVGASLFFAATDGLHGRELWMTDGTRAGTVMVEDIRLP